MIQVGTANTVSASGVVTTSAFYELLPAAAQEIVTLVVRPGDSIKASVTQISPGQWSISITNTTTTQTYTTSLAYSSSLSSAEWVEEDPSYINGSLIPFDTFGTVNFTSSFATKNGLSVDLNGAGSSKITMVDKAGTQIAVPSAIGSDGLSFSVTSH